MTVFEKSEFLLRGAEQNFIDIHIIWLFNGESYYPGKRISRDRNILVILLHALSNVWFTDRIG